MCIVVLLNSSFGIWNERRFNHLIPATSGANYTQSKGKYDNHWGLKSQFVIGMNYQQKNFHPIMLLSILMWCHLCNTNLAGGWCSDMLFSFGDKDCKISFHNEYAMFWESTFCVACTSVLWEQCFPCMWLNNLIDKIWQVNSICWLHVSIRRLMRSEFLLQGGERRII